MIDHMIIMMSYHVYTCRYLFNLEGGFKVFFRGINPALIGAIPARAIILASYSVYGSHCDTIPYLQSNIHAARFTSGILASKYTAQQCSVHLQHIINQ